MREAEAVLDINRTPVDGHLDRVGSVRSPVCESDILSGCTPSLLLGSRGGEGKAGKEGGGGSDELHFE